MDPKEANRALQKGNDFNREKQWKKVRKSISQTKTQQRQNSENVDFSLVFTIRYARPPFAQFAKIEANTRAERSKTTIKI